MPIGGGGLPQIGVEAIFVTKLFEAGAKVYNQGLKEAEKATSVAAAGMTSAGGGLGGIVGGAFTVAGGAISTFATVAVAGLAAAGVAVAGFVAATAGLALAAARVSGVEFAFQRMGGSVGLSLDALRSAAAGTISDFELMQRSNLALAGSGQRLADEFGKNLPKLLEMTRAAARATGLDFNYVFDSLVVGIKRASPRLIDNIGIQLKLGESNEAFAASVGKTVEQLTAEDKQLAVMNAVMQAAPQYLNIFKGSQESLGEALARVKTNFTNITQTLGQYFVPALRVVVNFVDKLSQAFFAAIREGGSLYPILVKLGAIMKFLAEAFVNGATVIMDFFLPMLDGIGTSVTDVISNMYNWGVDLIIEFARGIVDGATAALTAAINFVSSILSFFFSTNSPPEVAPDIDKWGAETMNEWLGGFSQADFDVLKSLQSPLKTALDIMAKTGQIGKDAAGTIWADISEAMIGGLGGGDLSGAFSKIIASSGKFGSDLVKLVQLNLQLAKATDAVTAAEKRLAASRKQEDALNTKLQLQLMEYNDLARAGASPAVLAAKLAAINATEDSLMAQQGETKAAEESVDAAKEQMDMLKEQVALQKQLVDQMLEIAKARIPEADKAAAPKGAGGGLGGLDAESLFDPAIFDAMAETFQQKVGLAIDVAKIIMYIKLKELWNSLVFEVQQGLSPAIEAFRAKWSELEAIIAPIMGRIVTGVNWFLLQLQQWWAEHGANVTLLWNSLWFALGNAWEAFKTQVSADIAATLKFFTDLFGAETINWNTLFSDSWKFIQTIFVDTLDAIGLAIDVFALAAQSKWDEMWALIVKTFEDKTTLLGQIWESVKTTVIDPITKAFMGIYDAIDGVITKIDNMIEAFAKIKVKLPYWLQPGSPTPLELGLIGIGDAMENLAKKSMPQMAYGLTSATMSPAMAAQSISTNNYRTANVNMGGVNINGNMGAAEFEAAIRRILRSEFST